MSKIKLEVDARKCDRCGHIWIPRGEGEPTVCPECKSPYWDIPKKGDKK